MKPYNSFLMCMRIHSGRIIREPPCNSLPRPKDFPQFKNTFQKYAHTNTKRAGSRISWKIYASGAQHLFTSEGSDNGARRHPCLYQPR